MAVGRNVWRTLRDWQVALYAFIVLMTIKVMPLYVYVVRYCLGLVTVFSGIHGLVLLCIGSLKSISLPKMFF
jgi:hypothetical protein